MARRSSARLRGQTPSTPQRVSLAHDAEHKVPRTAPVKLGTLHENEAIPGAFPQSASPPARAPSTPLYPRVTSTIAMKFGDETPKANTPLVLPAEEMHPQQHHQSTAKPLEEARWLGFTSMGLHTEPAKQRSDVAAWHDTPTRKGLQQEQIVPPTSRFTFCREQSLDLSPQAKQLMYEKREEAAKIREQMIAKGETRGEGFLPSERKIAMPKSQKSRFSEVHLQQFKKMESIAGHASAFRSELNRKKSTAARTPPARSSDAQQDSTPSAHKSLKRSPTKAGLDEPERPSTKSSVCNVLHSPARLASQPNEVCVDTAGKRIKLAGQNEAIIACSSDIKLDYQQPATPQSSRALQIGQKPLSLASLATPTQASLARTTSIKSTKATKIPAPSILSSPSKLGQTKEVGHTSNNLLTRSPSKAIKVPVGLKFSEPKDGSCLLLQKSPSKDARFGKDIVDMSTQQTASESTPLLSRSPVKNGLARNAASDKVDQNQGIPGSPLLSRSPQKLPAAKTDINPCISKQSESPLLTRSPSKFTMHHNVSTKTDPEPTGAPSSSKSLLGRTQMLRASPVKSILRSPQRLYSDDPAKVAAGTHLATPPKCVANQAQLQHCFLAVTAPLQKHVDFTSSTKDRYERAQSETSSTPSRDRMPTFKGEVQIESSTSRSPSINYPSLPGVETKSNITPQKRRQTGAPSDFTFRADMHDIVFSPSPKKVLSSEHVLLANTIRQVSAEPQPVPPTAGSKKRKFDFENDVACVKTTNEGDDNCSDKENSEEASTATERPMKRVKPNTPAEGGIKKTLAKPPLQTKNTTRAPTLGVKPRGTRAVPKDTKDKRPATISRSRLNALAQPKKRV